MCSCNKPRVSRSSKHPKTPCQGHLSSPGFNDPRPQLLPPPQALPSSQSRLCLSPAVLCLPLPFSFFPVSLTVCLHLSAIVVNIGASPVTYHPPSDDKAQGALRNPLTHPQSTWFLMRFNSTPQLGTVGRKISFSSQPGRI